MVVEPKRPWLVEFDLPAPAAVAWDYVTSPARRSGGRPGYDSIEEATAAGAAASGPSTIACTARTPIVEEIVDWRPPEYYTFDFQVPIPGAPKIRPTEELDRDPEGTRGRIVIARPRSSKERAFLEAMLPTIEPMFTAGRVALAPLLAEEVARQTAEPRSGASRTCPSAGRFMEPVQAPMQIAYEGPRDLAARRLSIRRASIRREVGGPLGAGR